MPDGYAPLRRLTFRVPVPPSANNLYANMPFGGGRRKTGEYRAWLNAAGWEMRAQHVLPLPAGNYALRIRAPINRRRDLDNTLKPVLDLIVELGLIRDDNLIDKIIIERDRSNEMMAVEIEVL